jgi:murein DD-endopeptidase MepM/ murein hydrolase activator NlpD
MRLWLITTAAAAAAAVTAPGAPPPAPHLHYEIRINGVDQHKLTDTEKLQLACAMSYGISGRVHAQANADAVLNNYLATLQQTTCVKPKSN